MITISGIANAQTFNITTGTQSWNVAGNWTPLGVPNAVGASATFNSPHAIQTVNLAAAITVGAISFTNNGSSNFTLANGTGGSLTFDAVGSGPATVTYGGTNSGTNNFTISASVTLNDTLQFTNNNTAGGGTATATMTGTVAGTGGFTKAGPGRFTFSTTAKTYTGPTTINQGRLRFTGPGVANATSSITVNDGGSLYLDSNSNAWTFGNAATTVITINGGGDNGGGTGTQGAIRNQGSGTVTLANAVALGSDATIHAEGSSTFSLNGAVSGNSVLTKTGGGTLRLTNANSGIGTQGYSVTNGTILVNSTSKLGSGALTFAQTAGNNTTVTLNNAAQTVGSLSSTFTDTTGTFAQTLNLTGTALTVNQTSDGIFGPGAVSTLTSVIAGTGSLTKSGPAKLTLTGANTYTGTTTISGGTLEAGVTNALQNTSGITVNTGGTLLLSGAGDNRINDSATITMSGGTIAFTGNVAEGSSPGTGALTLTASSVIDFGGGNDLINFAASNLATWTGGTILSIWNWAGSYSGGGNDQLKFGIDSTALTSTQLAQINFYSGAGTGFLGTGGFVGSLGEVVPVPEPSGVSLGLLLMGLAGWRERHRETARRQALRRVLA